MLTIYFYFLAARIADSLQRLLIYAPEKPGVRADSLLEYSSMLIEVSSGIPFK